MKNRSGRFVKRVQMGLLLMSVATAAGCGYVEYEHRLKESRKYYAYLNRIEQSLAAKWIVAGNLMSLRVPRQFSLIPAPQPPDGTQEPAIDSRQPDYLVLNFPELYGAWQASFNVTKQIGVEECKGYIYVLSNYWELASKSGSEAAEFTANLKTLLTDRLGIAVADEPPAVFPTSAPLYQAQVSYDVCSFKGKNINDTNYTFDVYSHNTGGVIGVIVVVLPEGIDASQKITERIPLMLASFTITHNPPQMGAGSNSNATGAPNTGF